MSGIRRSRRNCWKCFIWKMWARAPSPGWAWGETMRGKIPDRGWALCSTRPTLSYLCLNLLTHQQDHLSPHQHRWLSQDCLCPAPVQDTSKSRIWIDQKCQNLMKKIQNLIHSKCWLRYSFLQNWISLVSKLLWWLKDILIILDTGRSVIILKYQYLWISIQTKVQCVL